MQHSHVEYIGGTIRDRRTIHDQSFVRYTGTILTYTIHDRAPPPEGAASCSSLHAVCRAPCIRQTTSSEARWDRAALKRRANPGAPQMQRAPPRWPASLLFVRSASRDGLNRVIG